MEVQKHKQPRNIYLAGAMRGKPRYNQSLFARAAKWLRSIGHYVWSPSENDSAHGFDFDKPLDEQPPEWSLQRAVDWNVGKIIKYTDTLVLLPDWEQSAGTQMELLLAQIMDRDVWQLLPGRTDDFAAVVCPRVTFTPDYVTEQKEKDGCVLEEAAALVGGDRNNQYGPPNQDFARTAQMLTGLFQHMLADPVNNGFRPYHVALIMICLKCSRAMWSPEKRDTWVDIGGYSKCGHSCATEELNTDGKRLLPHVEA